MSFLPASAEQRLNRLIFRCVCEFLVDEARAKTLRFGGAFNRAMIFTAIEQATGEEGPARGVSVRAVAQSLGLPYETTRRQVRHLEDQGLVRRVGEFEVQSEAPTEPPETVRARQEVQVDGLTRVIAGLKRLGLSFDTLLRLPEIPADERRREVARLVDGFLLRAIEVGAVPHDSVMDGVLYSGLLVLNAGPITHDPELANLYGRSDTPPPDALRRAAPLTALAKLLGMPHETVRRRIHQMEQRGCCERIDGGYLIVMAHMQQPEILRSGQFIVHRFLQLTQAVQQVGFDVAGIAPTLDHP